jgi:ribosome-associated protein
MVEEHDFISRSQRKRDAQALHALGLRLVELSAPLLAGIELSGPVREAVEKARRIRQHVARKRQLQYLAKLLRNEEDVSTIFAALDEADRPAREDTLRLHRLESWRERLLRDGDPALTELVSGRPDLDVQAMRQLIRLAKKEANREVPPKASRQIFHLLRDWDDLSPLP